MIFVFNHGLRPTNYDESNDLVPFLSARYHRPAMDCAPNLRTDKSVAIKSGVGVFWIIVLLGLFVWQGWMTLTLFDHEHPWQRLLDDRPIVSGRHPLHLYHGYLGARALRERGTLCCYDPAFYAGYPKTPVFDSGSRPAELFLTVAGGTYRPEAYKIGLAICCLAAPLLVFAAAHGAGLGAGASCLAVALGLFIWWGTPCRDLLEAGELDFLLAGLAALAQLGLLVRFDRRPGLGGWAALLANGCLGWFAQPALFCALFPLVLIYYFSVGARHRLAWHLALFSAFAGGIGVNSFWLFDWLGYCWIRAPLQAETLLVPHRTFPMLWAARLWGQQTDRIVAGVVLGGALVGVWLLNATRQRPAARLLGLGAVEFLSLAVAGLGWEPLARLGTPRFFVPALWFAAVPAAYGLAQGAVLACRLSGGVWRGAALIAGLLTAAGLAARDIIHDFAVRCASTTPLSIGVADDDQVLVDLITSHTTPNARILWEDCCDSPTASRWSALLPLLTDRAYLSGLDANACIEHAYPSFVNQKLAGRPIASWRDEELRGFCRRYNAGWAVCRSPAAVARFRAWLGTEPIATVSGSSPVYLYQLPLGSFILKGRAQFLYADWRSVALADVTPEDGKVILSMHYQAGLRVSPSRVQIEKEPDPYDPIPLVRLRVPGPVARLTLTWQPP
jgi:hypothetical protein